MGDVAHGVDAHAGMIRMGVDARGRYCASGVSVHRGLQMGDCIWGTMHMGDIVQAYCAWEPTREEGGTNGGPSN